MHWITFPVHPMREPHLVFAFLTESIIDCIANLQRPHRPHAATVKVAGSIRFTSLR
jgi:hypothetical protein